MFDDNNYLEHLKGLKVVLIEGESCANCISVKYDIMQLKDELDFDLINIEANESLTNFIKIYDVTAVPSILVFHDDKLIAKAKGYQPKEILQIWLESKFEGKR